MNQSQPTDHNNQQSTYGSKESDLVDTTVFSSNRLIFIYHAINRAADIRLVCWNYFYSIMSYGIVLWGNAADINTNGG